MYLVSKTPAVISAKENPLPENAVNRRGNTPLAPFANVRVTDKEVEGYDPYDHAPPMPQPDPEA